MRFKIIFILFLLVGFHSKTDAQCFQIESILVDAFDSPSSGEGLNEMVRFKIGSSAIGTSNMVVYWPSTGNAWLGLIQNTTIATKIATINANIIASGGCGQLIEPTAGILPANANVLLITSFNFDQNLNIFGGITQNIYVIFQNNISLTTGNFGNYGAPANRTLTIGFGSTCSDTVTYDRSLLVDSLGNNAAENGATVNFTPAGIATYTNIGNSAPVNVFSVDAGLPSITACAGDIIPLNGVVQGQLNQVWSAPSGTFSNASNASTNFSIPNTASGQITVRLTATNTCGGTKFDTVTINVTPQITPLFAQVAPICAGSNPTALPTISTNNISGFWTPAMSSTVGRTYTFTPLPGQCATSQTMTTTINNNCTFGDFASAVFISNCTNDNFYNSTGAGADRINTTGLNFQNANLGAYTQNSNSLILKGAELKSFKTTSTNVCNVKMKYRFYNQTATPGAFQNIAMPLYDTCNTTTGFFNSGGPCVTTDQKWQNLFAAVDLTNNPVGNYFLEVYYDINGDSNSPTQCDDTVLVNNSNLNYRAAFYIVAAPVITSIISPSCNTNNGSFTVTGLAPNTTYQLTYQKDGSLVSTSITTNANGEIVVGNIGAGAYNFITFRVNGCSFMTTTNIGINSLPNPPTPTFSKLDATCSSPTGSITVLSPLGTEFTYSIDGSDYQSSPIFNNVVPGTYNLTVKNIQNCLSNGVTISILAPAAAPSQATFNKVNATCTNARGSVTILTPLGPDFTYSIDGIVYQSQVLFANLLPNTYNITVKNTAGCISTTVVTTINTSAATPLAPTIIATQPTCSNAFGSITIQSPVGSQYTYSRDGSNFQTSNVFTNVSAGTYNIVYQDGSGCISASATTTIMAQPVLNAVTYSKTDALCNQNGSITIQSPLGSNYMYSIDNINFQNNFRFNNLSSAIYDVSVRDVTTNCTSATISVTINNNTSTIPINLGIFEICLDQNGQPITSNTIYTEFPETEYNFVWTQSGNPLLTTTSFLTTNASGTYQAIATDKISGCVQVFDAVVLQISSATATAAVNTDFSGNQTIEISVKGGSGSFLYQINSSGFQPNNVFNVTNGGYYSIDIKDIAGCNDLTLNVNVIDFPRFFTPNGDGYNDYWNVNGLPFPDQSSLVIFDRFGKLLRQIGLRSIGWDGKFISQDLPADDYWFKLNYLDNTGNAREFKSHFSLKR